MPKQRKPVYAWAIVTPRGRLDTDSVRATRVETIWRECWTPFSDSTEIEWAKRKAQGYRCVKVEIREVGK